MALDVSTCCAPRVLRDAGLVTATKRGVNIWYAAVPEQLEALRGALQARAHA